MARRVAPMPPGVPALEPIRQDLYDTKQQLAAGSVGTLEFFINPAAGAFNSNMQASGQLPYPQQFHAFGICCEILPLYSNAVGEGKGSLWFGYKKNVREGAFLRLRIGSKDYLVVPLRRIPTGVGPTGFGTHNIAAGVEAVVLTHGIPDVQQYYDLTIRQHGKIKPIHIPAQQAFKVQIIWPTAPTVVADLDMIIRVYLVGILWREVQ